MLCIFPLTCGGTLVSHRTPDIFLQLFHPHCVLMFISVLLSPNHRGPYFPDVLIIHQRGVFGKVHNVAHFYLSPYSDEKLLHQNRVNVEK